MGVDCKQARREVPSALFWVASVLAISSLVLTSVSAQTRIPSQTRVYTIHEYSYDTTLQLGQLHGVTIAKGCLSPVCDGEATDCRIELGYNDDLGDSIRVLATSSASGAPL